MTEQSGMSITDRDNVASRPETTEASELLKKSLVPYQIYTTINTYPEGKAVPKELPFPKLFRTERQAREFGKGFFEPPETVKAWRIEKVEG